MLIADTARGVAPVGSWSATPISSDDESELQLSVGMVKVALVLAYPASGEAEYPANTPDPSGL
jgi:hypothetical protein